MNVKKLKELIRAYAKEDPQNDVASKIFWEESVKILTENLNETIEYLDSCVKQDLEYLCEVFDDISEYFKSKELIECMERNAKRTGVDCSVDIEYAKMALESK